MHRMSGEIYFVFSEELGSIFAFTFDNIDKGSALTKLKRYCVDSFIANRSISHLGKTMALQNAAESTLT